MASTPTLTEPPNRAVAPAWHTIVVLVALLGLSLAGARSRSLPFQSAYGRAPGYILMMVVEWAIVAFIAYGVRLRGFSLRSLIGGSWPRPLAVLRDLAIAVGFLVISGIVLNGLGYLLKATPDQALRNLFPHGPLQIALYLLLALTAGFCEEVMFRGYLQRQFTALTHNAGGGIVLQGIAFGAAHGYQGWRFMLIIAVFGIMFGQLAQWRRSLRPGMMAHFLQDGVGGLIFRHMVR